MVKFGKGRGFGAGLEQVSKAGNGGDPGASTADRHDKVRNHLQARLQPPNSNRASSSRSRAVRAPASATTALLGVDLSIPLPDLRRCLEAGGSRVGGRQRGNQDKRLAWAAAQLAQLGPVAYQHPGAAAPMAGVPRSAEPLQDAAEFDRQLESALSGGERWESALSKHRTASNALGALTAAAAACGLSQQDATPRGLLAAPDGPQPLLPRADALARAAAVAGPTPASAAPLLHLSLGLDELLRCLDSASSSNVLLRLGGTCLQLDGAMAEIQDTVLGVLDNLGTMLAGRERWARLEAAAALAQDSAGDAELMADAVAPGAFASRLHQKLPGLAHLTDADTQADSAAAAALRGHLLLQLVHRAWEEKLEGNCAALQDLVRPLQLAMADPGIKPEQLANLAAVLAGAPFTRSLRDTLSHVRLPAASERRGLMWRQMALILPLLAVESAAAPARDGSGEEGRDLQAEALAAAAMAAERPLPPDVVARLVTSRRRQLAQRLLLGLHRLQARRRLPSSTLRLLLEWVPEAAAAATTPSQPAGPPAPTLASRQAQGSASPMPSSDALIQIPQLPTDCLLALYTFVAAAFGQAFATPEDLGGCPAAEEAELWELGAADFAGAAATSLAGLSWEAGPRLGGGEGGGEDGGRQVASSEARLGLTAYAVQHALHQASWAPGAKARPLQEQPHLLAGWCPLCRAVVTPNCQLDHRLEGVAALAAGTLKMPAASIPAGRPTALAACERLAAGDSVLPAEGRGREAAQLARAGLNAQQAHPALALLCLARTVFHKLSEALCRDWSEAGEGLQLLHSADASQLQGDRLATVVAALDRSKETARRLLVVRRLLLQLAACGLRERLRGLRRDKVLGGIWENIYSKKPTEAAGKQPKEAGSKQRKEAVGRRSEEVGPQASGARRPLLLDSTEEKLRQCQEQLDANPSELCAWATAAKQLLMLRQAGVPDLRRPAALQEKLEAAAEGAAALGREVEGASQQLQALAAAAHWRALDVVSQLRQACAVHLAAPLEEAGVQRVLADRWLADSAGGAGAELDAADAQAAAEDAAAALLREEEEQQQAGARKKQAADKKRRAAEQKRRREAERQAEAQRRQEEEEAARRKQEEEEEAARRKQEEEEEAARRKREEEEEAARRKQEEEDEAARRKQEEEEEAARRKQQEEEKAARRKQQEEEAARRRQQEEEDAKQRKQQEEEEAARRKQQGERAAAAQRREQHAAERRKQEEAEAGSKQQGKEGGKAAGRRKKKEAAARVLQSGLPADARQQDPQRLEAELRPKEQQVRLPEQAEAARQERLQRLMSGAFARRIPQQAVHGSLGLDGEQGREAPPAAANSAGWRSGAGRQRQEQEAQPQAAASSASSAGNHSSSRPASAAGGVDLAQGLSAALPLPGGRQAPAQPPPPPSQQLRGRERRQRRQGAPQMDARELPPQQAQQAQQPLPLQQDSLQQTQREPLPSQEGQPAAAPIGDPGPRGSPVEGAPASRVPASDLQQRPLGLHAEPSGGQSAAAMADVAAAAARNATASRASPPPLFWDLPGSARPAESSRVGSDEAELEEAMLVLGSSEPLSPPLARTPDSWASLGAAPRPAAGSPAAVPHAAMHPPAALAGSALPPLGQHSAAEPVGGIGELWLMEAAGGSSHGMHASPPRVPTPDLPPAEAAAGRASAPPLPLLPAAAPLHPLPAGPDAAARALPGLRNEAGDFNCFLNVVLQCLWRCADFRRQVLSWPLAVYWADPVLQALTVLFRELTAADAVAASGSMVRHQHVVIDPTPLREAINALPGQEFKLGEMSDAGELLLVLFEHMKGVAPAVAGAAVDAVFGLRVAEAVECQSCGRETQQCRYTQYFFNTFAAALRSSLAAGPDPGFGARLRRIEDEHKKSCDTDVGGCGTLHPVRQELEGEPPRVFTLQLVWESHEEEPATIGATLKALAEQIDLGQLYADLMPGTLYRLRAMVCYYGRHYSAFVHLPQLSRWVTFDDSSAGSIGSWSDVRQRCESGRVQPSVLFYEAVS